MGPLSAVANLANLPYPQVVAGNTVYYNDGAVMWYNPNVPDGFPGVADFSLNGIPDVVVVVPGTNCYTSPAEVYLLDGRTGVPVWPNPVSLEDSRGGAPTIGDFLGDGYPAIGVATSHNYTVISHTGQIAWAHAINDTTSGVCCASAFEFDEGSGHEDIVYADQNTLWIFDGKDGAALWHTPRPSGTTYEMPVIADIDNDRHAEIVVGDNDYCALSSESGMFGVYAYGNAEWPGTRPIWNQHTYHIANILNDATVPTPETNNWAVDNNYRCQPVLIYLPSVGGISAPVDKLSSLSPYIGLVFIIAVATVATAIHAKRIKRRNEKR
jgi:hypothetical protein